MIQGTRCGAELLKKHKVKPNALLCKETHTPRRKRIALAVGGENAPSQAKRISPSLKKNKSEQYFGSFATEEEQAVAAKVVVPLSMKIVTDWVTMNKLKRHKSRIRGFSQLIISLPNHLVSIRM